MYCSNILASYESAGAGIIFRTFILFKCVRIDVLKAVVHNVYVSYQRYCISVENK